MQKQTQRAATGQMSSTEDCVGTYQIVFSHFFTDGQIYSHTPVCTPAYLFCTSIILLACEYP